MLDRTQQREDSEKWCARSSKGMVATAHYLATAAGAEMLAKGGNAADADVAASLALGVCEPASSGLGGNAMALLHLESEQRTIVLSGPCRSPRRATAEAVSSSRRYRGYRAVAVPTNVAVLEKLHDAHGALPPGVVFEPAIRIAESGYRQTLVQERLARRYRRVLAAHSAGSLFLDTSTGQPLPAGTWIRRPALGRTLERLVDHGFRDFYEGGIARQIVATMHANDGFIDSDDLIEYSNVAEVAPLRGALRDIEVCTSPPPSGGLTLVHMLQLFDALESEDLEADAKLRPLVLAEVIRRARSDRVAFRLETGSEGVGGAGQLLDPGFARRQAAALKARIYGGGETSHISVADDRGTLVSLTQSIERSFGSAEVDPDLGFLYNGFMRGFKTENRRHPHFVAPGAAARSNACPSILLREGRGYGAIGSTGSERMASGILQVLVRVRLRQEVPFDAVAAPRLHATPTGTLMYEDRFASEALGLLSSHGYALERYDPFSFKFGCLNLVLREGDVFVGVGDPRRDGAAAGPDA